MLWSTGTDTEPDMSLHLGMKAARVSDSFWDL